MTTKEAIEWLNCLKEIHEDDISDALGTWYKDIKADHNVVIDMAIKALEKQIKTDISHTTVCPKCKAPIEIASFTNFDNLVTDYYPLCHECGWTTRNTYSSKEAAVADIKKLFFTTKDETIGKDTNVRSNDTISRQAAIDGKISIQRTNGVEMYSDEAVPVEYLKALPYAQPEQPSEIQDILDYLDTVLHPIISPEHWNVYSELHDMISTLPSAQPEIIRCKDCKYWRQQTNYAGAPLSFGFCESDEMRRSLYGETCEVSHIDTDDDNFCSYAERRTDEPQHETRHSTHHTAADAEQVP